MMISVFAAASGCSGGFPQDTPRASIQELLRRTAAGASIGGTYWLGPTFRQARVTNASAGWHPHASITYSASASGSSGALDFDVNSYRGAAPPSIRPFSETRIHLEDGQDIAVFFRTPRRPSATLLRQVRAALKLLPPNVNYPE